MDAQCVDWALTPADWPPTGTGEGAPLIDFTQDLAQDEIPDIDIGDTAQPVQELTTPQRGSSLPSVETSIPCSSPVPPIRSVRELVEALGSPIYSSTSASVVSRRSNSPPFRLPSPSPFDDPVTFDGPTGSNRNSTNSRASPGFRTSDTASFIRFDQDPGRPSGSSGSLPSSSSPAEQSPPLERTFGRDQTNFLNVPQNEFPTPPLTPSAPPRVIIPSWLNRPASPRPASPIPYALSSTRFVRPTNTTNPFRRCTRPLPTAPAAAPVHPWNAPTTTDHEAFNRPDRFSRTTAHTTISDILFNFDLDPAAASELIDDACQTARQVGVSTHDLLSRSVFLGMSDLGMTPLCLEASRVDVDAGLELVLWLIENSNPSEVNREVKKGCLMRRNGMGEQAVWNVLRGFVPEVDGQAALAYDVEVEGLAVVPRGKQASKESDDEGSLYDEDDDEGSLYDDVSIIDAESGFLDQADIETLKSSSDEELDRCKELDKGKEKEVEPEPELSPPRVHRARIVLPSFKESLTGPSWAYTSPSPSNRFGMASSGSLGNDQVITAEWMFEGRLWALSIGEDTLILTLRETSALVPSDPIKVKAVVRLLPFYLPWAGVREVDHIGSDGLLPTQTPNEILLQSPLYECELEGEVVPGPVGVGMNSSVCKTEIRVSMFTLLGLVGADSGVKVEVVVRVSDRREPEMSIASTSGCVGTSIGGCVSDEAGTTIADDTSEWQFVDD